MSMIYEPHSPEPDAADPRPPALPPPPAVPTPAPGGVRVYAVPSHLALAPAPAAPSRWAAVTVADGLMVVIGVLAAVLRLGDLARLPLSAAEAAAALTNWQAAGGATLTAAPTSPAYFAFTHLIFSLGGAGDAGARLVPALFGLLTVLLPWLLLRGRARPALWLVAGLLLAVSPLLVAVSRTAGGDAIALFALLLLALAGGGPLVPLPRGEGTVPLPVGEVRRGFLGAEEKDPLPNPLPRGEGTVPLPVGEVRRGFLGRSAVLAGIALGLGLTSSPLFYTGLVALLPALYWLRGGRGAGWRPFVLAAAVTFVAVASGLLLRPEGLGGAMRLLPAWLGGFGLPAGGDWASPFLALLRYEPALLIVAAPAAVWAWLAGDRAGRALSLWLGATLLLIVLQPGVMINGAAAVLPGALLAGLLAADLLGQRAALGGSGRRVAWGTAGVLVGLGALALAVVGRFARLNLLSGEDGPLIGLAALAFVLATLAVVLALAWDNPAARRGALVGALALLLFWQWGAAWQLSRLGANDPRERWVTSGTDADARRMTDLVGRISRQTANSESDLSVFSLVDSPVMAWYLRDLVGFQSGPTLPANATPDVVIGPAAAEPPLYADYYGADFDLTQTEGVAAGATLNDTLRWLLFRESNAVVDMERVIVWIRSDLGKN